MTINQKRAMNLALQVLRGSPGNRLHDGEWQLLLLAAGINNMSALDHVVARRVLSNAEKGVGYYAAAPCPSTQLTEPLLPSSDGTGLIAQGFNALLEQKLAW